MVRVIEPNENGEWVLPKDLIEKAGEHVEYTLHTNGKTVTLVSADEEPKRTKEEAEAWVKSFREWVRDMKPKTPHLTDEALRRESFYD